ncbi:MAG: hypothetical protein MNPFHGCM_02990 [Gemmatimonadaceae bacterium]|nr:hypothetical protein [Gemmatimonadaceae bacterium]
MPPFASNTSLVALAVAIPFGAVRTQVVDYGRAEQMLTWNASRFVYGDQVTPNWYRDSTRFWYRVTTPRGAEFVSVNPASMPPQRALLFDNDRLAAALSRAADTAVAGTKLPFRTFRFENDGRDERRLRIRMGKSGFSCDIVEYTCVKADTLPNRLRFVRSPDERWDAFIAGHNIWIRPVSGGDSIQLTTDGVAGYGYGAGSPSPTLIRLKQPVAPQVYWSPDSKRLAIARIDERGVQKFHLYSSTTIRPTSYEYPYSLPGDSAVEMLELYVGDVAARSSRKIDAPAQPLMSLYGFSTKVVQWAPASDKVFFTHVDRGPKHVRVMVADAAGGAARTLFADSSRTYVIGSPDVVTSGTLWRPLKSGDMIWFSERDGWGHLYLVGADGAKKGQITSGPWVVTALVAVDETRGRLYFLARGREQGRHPEYDFLYGVNLDGSGLALLSPEEGMHSVAAIAGGKFFIDVWSRVDTPPTTVLRSAEGKIVRELERADIAQLRSTGWRPGEIFTAKARDGITEITGVLYKPSNFDSTKRYPVIDHIYPGPLISPVSKVFYPSSSSFSYSQMGQVQALAELGFVVLEIDALGNTPRNKSLYTLWYGNMGDNGIPDHVTAIKQLGARFPWMDMTRVGIYGHSGGGFSSTDAMLRFPDFYSVAVSTAGNHDNRTYYHGWGERFQGPLVKDSVRGTDSYVQAANKTFAANLRGHLFLVHGDMDDNVHPAHTIALVDALVKANKRFDLLILPDADHNLTQHPYVIRRTWDFFVEHLLHGTAPENYSIAPPP